MSAVVDYVLSGHRYKLLLPRESCAVAFALSGVRCPGKGEPYSEQAIAFMRRKIMQHDVEVRGGWSSVRAVSVLQSRAVE